LRVSVRVILLSPDLLACSCSAVLSINKGIGQPAELLWSLLITNLAVVHDCDGLILLLFGFDNCERVPEPFVLDDCSRTYTLILIEDAVGKYMTLPAHFNGSIKVIVNLDVPTGETFRDFGLLENDLLSLVVGMTTALPHIAVRDGTEYRSND
jgi:hypothetical protein